MARSTADAALPVHGPSRQPPQTSLRIHDEADPERGCVEAFIADVYARRYAARVSGFAPRLVSVRDGERIVAAAGYRVAREPLFLERYLDAPIEAVLGVHAGSAPSRDTIVEIGHLAANEAGEGRRLFPRIAEHLAAQGLQWGVSTLTRELRHLLARMGVAAVALAPADPARLGAAALDWGHYYRHAPTLMAGHLPEVTRRFAALRTSAA